MAADALSNAPEAAAMKKEEEDDMMNSTVEQVALTVSTTDDPTIPAVTFRMWVLGIVSCALLAFLNQFFWYRRTPIIISSLSAQISVVPIGHLLARVLPSTVFFSGTPLAFSLNPGPFNMKEHVLITILANSGAGVVYAIHIVTSMKVFYRQDMNFWAAFFLILTTQVLGFGWAGMFRKYLVEPAAMWWPSTLVQVTLFRALHEKEERPKGKLTRNQFFLVALTTSFAYYIFPSYLFAMLMSISWVCWIFPSSVLVHQLGSGIAGMGVGSFALDWSTVISYLGSPLASPWFATANIAVGYVLVMYILTPVSYFKNVYNAHSFPIFSSHFFNAAGHRYNTSKILDAHFHLDVNAYEREGPLYISAFFVMTYGIGFAALTSSLSHVALFYGKTIMKTAKTALSEKKLDVHTRMMRKYKQVPEWWFTSMLIVTVALTIFACEYYNDSFQLPWWGVLLACGLSLFFTLPFGIIMATTNQLPGLNIITEYIMGLLLPGLPAANMCFKTYGYVSMMQAVTFLSDFKLGHYMKIPPRAMFMAQVVGTLISGSIYLITAWWLIESIPNICNTDLLPLDSPWTCPMDRVFYDASVIYGLIGPRRVFGDLGHYSAVNWFFLAGALAPVLVWTASKIFPGQKWIKLINIPLVLSATGMMPPASAVNYTSWLIIGFISGFVTYRYKREWWKRYNYVLSAGLEAGAAFMAVLIFFALQYSKEIRLAWWGNDPDGCPLASCPTQPGIVVDGCPAIPI